MRSVGERTQRAAILQLAVKAILIVGGMAQQIVVARIVDPSVYGLIGMVMLTIAFLTVFSETGVAGSIILEESIGTNELDFAWTLQVFRGVVLGVVAFSVAPLAASFFGQPDLVNLLRFAAIGPFFTGLASPRLLQLRRELAYGRLSALQLSNLFVNLGVSIPLAIMWRNAWALLVPFVLASVVRSALSYVLAPHRSRWFWDQEMAARFSRFGRWAFVNNILHYVINEADKLVIGRMLNPASLGLYSMAHRIGNMPFSEFGGVIGEVAFPSFRKAESHIQSAFLKLFGTSFLVTAPAATGLGLIAPTLVQLILGDQWTGIVLPLQILCGWAVVRSLSVVTGPLFNALGRPDIQTRIATIYAIVLVIGLIPAISQWGIVGSAIALTVSTAFMVPIIMRFAHNLIHFDIRLLLRLTMVPLAASTVMALGVVVVNLILDKIHVLVLLGISIGTGMLTYIACIAAAKQFLGYSGADTILVSLGALSTRIRRLGRA